MYYLKYYLENGILIIKILNYSNLYCEVNTL